MPSTMAQRTEANPTTSDVLSDASYEQARQIGVEVSNDTAPRAPAAETVTSSRTSGSITVRLIPVPARNHQRGTAT